MIGFLNTNNYNTYNINYAHILGLKCAVYLGELCNYVDSRGFLREIDIEDIQYKTTFTPSQQEKLKQKLIENKILLVKEDLCYFNEEYLISLLNSTTKKVLKNKGVNNSSNKRSKKDIIKDNLRACIKTTNGELRDAYSEWIDAVVDRQGWMTKKSVELREELIDNFSNRNLDIAIKILNIASINGYRDIQWAINCYNKSNNNYSFKNLNEFNTNRSNLNNTEIKLSEEIF